MDMKKNVSILLSRDELLLILNLLHAQSIPGLDEEPLGEWSPEQRVLAQVVAERALRARELAQRQSDDQLVIHKTLLTAVGVCAYAQSSIFSYHWPEPNVMPARYFGHVRGDDIVAHTRPQDVLHLFSLLPSKEQLIDQIIAFCHYQETTSNLSFEFTLAQADFMKLRKLAETGLNEPNFITEQTKHLSDTLANKPRVSVFQLISQNNQQVQKRDFTLIQDAHITWLILAMPEEQLLIKSITQVEFKQKLTEWL